MDFQEITTPKSSLEKTKLARKIYNEIKSLREIRDMAGWYMGKQLYFFDKFGLQNYLFGKAMSKNAFYGEIDIPISTVAYHIALYEFYVVKNGFTFEELKNSTARKLHRAIPLLQEKSKEKITEAVGLAKRETMGLMDFLEEIKEI